MSRIFIHQLNTPLAHGLCEALGADHPEMEIWGTRDLENPDFPTPSKVSLVEPAELEATLLSCRLVIYDLHTSPIDQISWAQTVLRNHELPEKLSFVLLSSVYVWGMHPDCDTWVDFHPPEVEDSTAEGHASPDELVLTATPIDPADRVDTLPDDWVGETSKPAPGDKPTRLISEAGFHARQPPSPKYAEWRLMETLTLALKAEHPMVHPTILVCGLLTGCGEGVLYDLFRAAWLGFEFENLEAAHLVPLIHVRQVGRLISHFLSPEWVYQEVVLCGSHDLTPAQITQGVYQALAGQRPLKGPPVPVPEILKGLDCLVQPSPFLETWDWGPEFLEGLPQSLQEFREFRQFRPIYLAILGPPLSGKSWLANFLAETYELPVINQELLDLMGGQTLPLETLRQLVQEPPYATQGYVLDGGLHSYAEACEVFALKPPEVQDPPENPEEGPDPADLELDAPAPPGPAGLQFMETTPEHLIYTGHQMTIEDLRQQLASRPPPRPDTQIISEFWEYQTQNPGNGLCVSDFFTARQKGCDMEALFLPIQGQPEESDAFEWSSSSGEEPEEPAEPPHMNIPFQRDSKGNRVHKVGATQVCMSYIQRKGVFPHLGTRAAIQHVSQAQHALKKKDHLQKAEEARIFQETQEENLRIQKEADHKAQEAKLKEIQEQEARQLEVKSQPIKDYLMKYVVPTLSEGLLQVCKLEPEDPIQYLADYLLAHAEDALNS